MLNKEVRTKEGLPYTPWTFFLLRTIGVPMHNYLLLSYSYSYHFELNFCLYNTAMRMLPVDYN